MVGRLCPEGRAALAAATAVAGVPAGLLCVLGGAGIAHRPLAEVSLDEAVREIAVSKLRLEEKLGRPVRAYAYVKGSEAHFHPVHESILKQAGYEIAFTSISRGNGPGTNPFRLGRYNVEPYPERTFDLVLSGACDLIALKDTVAGTHARRLFNQALGTSTR